MTIGPWQLVIICLVVALLFGSRFGEVAKGVTEGVRNFKRALAGKDQDKDAGDAS